MPGLGTLEAGAPADLLVFREDPTRDLAALSTLEAVVAQGRLYTRDSIERGLTAHRSQLESFLFDRIATAASRLYLWAQLD